MRKAYLILFILIALLAGSIFAWQRLRGPGEPVEAAATPEPAPYIVVLADGTQHLLAAPGTPAELLASTGIEAEAGDVLLWNGEVVQPDTALPVDAPGVLHLRRAHEILLAAGGEVQIIHSAAPTLGQALWEAGVRVKLADRILPPPETVLDGPLEAVLVRARPVTIEAGESRVRAYTTGETVGEALADAGLALQGLDYSLPAPGEPVPEGGTIRIVRVTEEVQLEQETIPFETIFQAAPDIELDTQEVLQAGAFGVQARRVRVQYENGVEVSREVEDTWTATAPKPRIVGYGTKIVVRTVDTPDGPVEYWRAVNVYATSYSPCRIFADRCSEITASGLKLQKGVVGVIRSWYNALAGTYMYIPGYGTAVIADIGAGFSDRHWVDLGYSDDDWVSWSSYVTVYFMTPVPPEDQILWVLP